MNIKINTVHFDADSKLLEFAEKKVTKLVIGVDEVIGAEVYLTFDASKPKHTDNKKVKIILEVPGYDLFAEKDATTFEEAVDQVVDALKKQIEKHKSKLK